MLSILAIFATQLSAHHLGSPTPDEIVGVWIIDGEFGEGTVVIDKKGKKKLDIQITADELPRTLSFHPKVGESVGDPFVITTKLNRQTVTVSIEFTSDDEFNATITGGPFNGELITGIRLEDAPPP